MRTAHVIESIGSGKKAKIYRREKSEIGKNGDSHVTITNIFMIYGTVVAFARSCEALKLYGDEPNHRGRGNRRRVFHRRLRHVWTQ
jgi:hypothetical protein